MGRGCVFERRSLAAGMPEVKYNAIRFEIGPNSLYMRSASPVGSWVFEIWRPKLATLTRFLFCPNFWKFRFEKSDPNFLSHMKERRKIRPDIYTNFHVF